LLLVLGVILMLVTARSYRQFTQEADQKLNRTLAENLAAEFSPFLQDSLDMAGIEYTMHYLMVMNPRVEIYLLDEAGQVLAFFADPAKIKQESVRLEPIRQFLAGTAEAPILGDDPRLAGRTKPFSVAPIQIDAATRGYLYVILSGEEYDSALSMVEESSIYRLTATAVLLILLSTGLVGLVLFFFLTKRFRKMTEGVRRFADGDLETRLDINYDDEVGHLGRAFNQMADTIVGNMAALRRSDDLRREMVANISHDLRSPLASIQGYIETILMKADALSDEAKERYLTVILDNTVMLNRLVSSLFELSKLDALEVQPRPEPFSVAELAQDVVMKFKPQAPSCWPRARPTSTARWW
jgi:signal transduction histidine kinase